jgi:hypothetical protein
MGRMKYFVNVPRHQWLFSLEVLTLLDVKRADSAMKGRKSESILQKTVVAATRVARFHTGWLLRHGRISSSLVYVPEFLPRLLPKCIEYVIKASYSVCCVQKTLFSIWGSDGDPTGKKPRRRIASSHSLTEEVFTLHIVPEPSCIENAVTMEEQPSMFHHITALLFGPSRPAAPHHNNPDAPTQTPLPNPPLSAETPPPGTPTRPPQNPLAGEAIATVGQLRDIRRKDTDIRVKVRVVDCRGNTYIPDASVWVDPDLKLCAASSLSSTSITDAFVDLKMAFLLQL